MQTSTNAQSARRGSAAWRLLASFFTVFVLGVAALAQTAPILTLNSPVGVFDFGRRNTGTTSAITVITMMNGGSSRLNITAVAITGANSGDFQLTATTCVGASLAANATCTASVRFAPLAFGPRQARLTVTNNASGSQHLVPLTGVGLNPSIPNRNAGPVDPRIGFPLWYQDDAGVRLQLCLDAAANRCLTPLPNTGAPASVNDRLINFPGEAFWWTAEAEIALPNGEDARLVLAKEAAFTSEEAAIGQQISFDRVRVRIEEVTPFAVYTITHPFGTMTVTADEDGDVDVTEDIGCGASPCNFAAALNGKISHFLKWDPAFAPAAPAGYLGDPSVNHRITGSPFSTNFFRVVGPNIGGPGVNTVTQNLFSVSGKLFTTSTLSATTLNAETTTLDTMEAPAMEAEAFPPLR
jgi:hypothetical protein